MTTPQGTLFIISTPIGNLKDITYRATETLSRVDFILAEDTRRTLILLNNFNIKKQIISYRDQNHKRVITYILKLLKEGKNLALVTDSGTPLISDPGYKLVRDVLEGKIQVISIPGPSAVNEALILSGLPTDKFTFLGFLPKKSGKRQSTLKEFGTKENSLIIYESPFRIIKLLEEILKVLGNRNVAICLEMTKMFETIYRGNVEELLVELKDKSIKGEVTVVVGKE